MRTRSTARGACSIAAIVAVLALAACGSTGSSKSGSSPPTTKAQQLSSPSWDKAGPTPSKSAKLVCEPEAQADIAASVGAKPTRVTKPVWVEKDHVYSCVYLYPHGAIGLRVKELVDEKTTTAYFNGIIKKYGTTRPLIGLGQGAWVLKNGNVVARKDYKVLLVDVRRIPPKFAPTMTRSDVSVNVAAAIMGCWTGA
jgi:hypothetical protein